MARGVGRAAAAVEFAFFTLGASGRNLMGRTRIGLAALLAGTALSFGLPAAAAEVTPARLTNAAAEPQNWMLPLANYSSHSFSPLNQINKGNVANLKVKFMHAIGGGNPSSVGGNNPGQRSTPMVADGIMYLHNSWAQVLKIDVRAGNRATTLWTGDSKLTAADSKPGGVALLGNDVFHVTRNDMRLIRFNGESGEIMYEQVTRGPDNVPGAERATGGQLAVKDKIITGAAGPGMRGWIGAFNAADGALRWRFYTVPGPGELGHDTWKDNHNAYLTGGAGIWSIPSYDPETNLLVFGTGEPQPWADHDFRPGDNLFSVSTVAVDVDTGKLKWFFQEIPDESWDYDTVSAKMLYDINVGGQLRKVAGTYSRNGFYYTLDRLTGDFVHAAAYRDDVNWTAGIDPKTGKPIEYNPAVLTQTYANNKSLRTGRPDTSQNVCPSLAGPTWWPPAYDPRKRIAWTTSAATCVNQTIAQPIDPTRTDLRGNGGMWGGGNFWTFPAFGPANGLMFAVDVTTSKKVTQVTTPHATNAGLLATAGDLVFGGLRDGNFVAYDADTLRELWSFNVGTPIGGPAISYAIGNTQYVAVVVGGTRGVGAPLNTMQITPMLVVFGL
jgi:alcohol dehydrogenase (cytochrome c)